MHPASSRSALESAADPLPGFAGLRLPLAAWALVFGARWTRALATGAPGPGVDTAVLERVERAVDWLAEQAPPDERTVVVTHASVRRLLAATLCQRGWVRLPGRSVRPWSAWTLQRRDAAVSA